MATARGGIVTAVVTALAASATFTGNAPREKTSVLPSVESLDGGPAVLVSDPASEGQQAAYGSWQWPVTVQVEVVAKLEKDAAGAVTPTTETLRGYAQAVLTAVGASSAVKALVADMRPGGVRINPGAPGDAVASVQVDLAFTYEAALWAM